MDGKAWVFSAAEGLWHSVTHPDGCPKAGAVYRMERWSGTLSMVLEVEFYVINWAELLSLPGLEVDIYNCPASYIT